MSFSKLNEIIQDTAPQINQYFLGTVVENNDPLGLDRIKVSVPELYNPEVNELPWCLPLKHPIFGQGMNHGIYGVPALNSQVIILLQKNDPNFPIYISAALISGNKSQDLGFDSPQKYGFVDPSGNKLLVDMETQTWTFTHSSGANVIINKDNKITVNCKDAEVNAQTSAVINTETATTNSTTSNINCTTSNVKCTTANTEANQFNVKASQTQFDCPTNNFAGVINCQSIATGYGGSGGTATITGDLEVKGDAEIANIQFSTHVHSGVEPGGGNTGTPH